MLDNMRQQGQVAAAVATKHLTTSGALWKPLTLPTITSSPSAVATFISEPSISPQQLPIPIIPYNTVESASRSGTAKMTTFLHQQNHNHLGFNLSTESLMSPPSSPHKPVCETYTVGSGVYVSRVTNIHISGPCTRTPYMSLRCAGDMAYNKRMCLDSRAVNDNKIKIPDKSCSMDKGMSQTRSLMVRRFGSGGALCWTDRAPYPDVFIQQPTLPITTSSSSTNKQCLINEASTSASQAGDTPMTILTVDRRENNGVVQEHKERRHIKAINNAFQMLRRALPWAGGTVAEKRPLGASATKMNTLRLATRYIRALEHLLEDNSADEDDSCSTSSSSQSSSCSPSPALSRTSLRSVGSDFSDMLSSDSFEDLGVLEELVALAEVEQPDAFMSDAKKNLNS